MKIGFNKKNHCFLTICILLLFNVKIIYSQQEQKSTFELTKLNVKYISDGLSFYGTFKNISRQSKMDWYVFNVEIIDTLGNVIYDQPLQSIYELSVNTNVPKNPLNNSFYNPDFNNLNGKFHYAKFRNSFKARLIVPYKAFYPDPVSGMYTIKIKVYSIFGSKPDKLVDQFEIKKKIIFPKIYSLKNQKVLLSEIKISNTKEKENNTIISYKLQAKHSISTINKGFNNEKIKDSLKYYDIDFKLLDSSGTVLYYSRNLFKPLKSDDFIIDRFKAPIGSGKLIFPIGLNSLTAKIEAVQRGEQNVIVASDSIKIIHNQLQSHLFFIDLKKLIISDDTGADSGKPGRHKTPDPYWSVKFNDKKAFSSDFAQNSREARTGKILIKTEKPKEFSFVVMDDDVFSDDFISAKTFTINYDDKKRNYQTPFKFIDSINLSYQIYPYEAIQFNILNKEIKKVDGLSILDVSFMLTSSGIYDDLHFKINNKNNQLLKKNIFLNKKYSLQIPLAIFRNYEVYVASGDNNDRLTRNFAIKHKSKHSINDVLYDVKAVDSTIIYSHGCHGFKRGTTDCRIYENKTKIHGVYIKTKMTLDQFYADGSYDIKLQNGEKEIAFIKDHTSKNTKENKIVFYENSIFVPYYKINQNNVANGLCLKINNYRQVRIGKLDTCFQVKKNIIDSIKLNVSEFELSREYSRDDKFYFNFYRGDDMFFSSDTISSSNQKLNWKKATTEFIKSHPLDEILLVMYQQDSEGDISLIYKEVYKQNKLKKKSKHKLKKKRSYDSVKRGKLMIQ
ncbi:hypothetical protein [Aquimarina algicola]|uniref:Uncharacterized protein n=1 Tax=Aquimarina algicola TaxID=2589995 RepID=A0A504J4M2_9FLAO|nr:hypothetical protein [Aquimarina algicola]TPN85906.1 hypothetical protein FHK87_11520 [Aquimarina algicola]